MEKQQATKGLSWTDILIAVLLALCVYLGYRQRQILAGIEILRQNLAAETEAKIILAQKLEHATACCSQAMAAVKKDEAEKFTPAIGGKISPGLYTLKSEVTLARSGNTGTFTEEFTIYHISTIINVGEKPWPVNIGLAVSGLTTTPRFYIDYDGDNKVDTELMMQYAYLMPFGSVLSKSIDPDNSQIVYNTFRSKLYLASFSSQDEIMAQGDQVSKDLWSFIQKNSSDIATWIAKQ